jgi:predicted NAD/FAD-binding protein
MKVAIMGGGASGMVTAYLLDKQGHQVTVFERQSVLGGHIRTLNQNVQPNHSACNLVLENGVLEFPTVFHNFMALMTELGVELEPVRIGSALFMKDGNHYFSGQVIDKNFSGWQRLSEYLLLDSLYARSISFLIKTKFWRLLDFHNQSLAAHFTRPSIRDTWLKLFAMYSYSIPFELLDNCPAELVIPMLRDDVFVDWVRIKGGVYSYIQKILNRFQGQIFLDVQVAAVRRTATGVNVKLSTGMGLEFDRVVFATPPDQVLRLLADPDSAEVRRFSPWQGNYIQTLLHSDMSMYQPYGIKTGSEFDFFQTDRQHGYWGYNANLNQLCGITSPQQYSLSFKLESLIAKDQIIHVQKHHTPLYTVQAFRDRQEIMATNGENHTYHVGAYLGDGLHEGAITSAIQVATRIGQNQAVRLPAGLLG